MLLINSELSDRNKLTTHESYPLSQKQGGLQILVMIEKEVRRYEVEGV